MTNALPIGIFDSGIGGLTVMRSIQEVLPHEDILYFGDTARVPYGNRSGDTIRRYSLECVAFLNQLQVKLLVVACHTACAHALDAIAESVSIPVVGVIQSGVDHLIRCTKTKQVAVLSTRATASSKAHEKAIHQIDPTITVYTQACPLFVPLIEEGLIDHPLAELATQEYLSTLPSTIDALFLACTHYPLFKKNFLKFFEEKIALIDPGELCALEVKEMLSHHHLLNPQNKKGSSHFFVSDDKEKFRELGKRFLLNPIESVTCTTATPEAGFYSAFLSV